LFFVGFYRIIGLFFGASILESRGEETKGILSLHSSASLHILEILKKMK